MEDSGLPSVPEGNTPTNSNSFPNKKGRTPKAVIRERREYVRNAYFIMCLSIRQIMAQEIVKKKGWTSEGIQNDIHAIEKEIERKSAKEGDFITRYNKFRGQAKKRCESQLARLYEMLTKLKGEEDINKNTRERLAIEAQITQVNNNLMAIDLMEDPKEIMVRKVMEMVQREESELRA